jgi:large subunit ribosomal protein L4
LFVLGDENANVYISSRNLKNSKVIKASEINTYGVLNANKVVITEGSLEGINTNLSK